MGHAGTKGTRRYDAHMQASDTRAQRAASTSALPTSIVMQVMFVETRWWAEETSHAVACTTRAGTPN